MSNSEYAWKVARFFDVLVLSINRLRLVDASPELGSGVIVASSRVKVIMKEEVQQIGIGSTGSLSDATILAHSGGRA